MYTSPCPITCDDILTVVNAYQTATQSLSEAVTLVIESGLISDDLKSKLDPLMMEALANVDTASTILRIAEQTKIRK